MRAASSELTPRVAMKESMRARTTSSPLSRSDDDAGEDREQDGGPDAEALVHQEPADHDAGDADLETDREVEDAGRQWDDQSDGGQTDDRLAVEQGPQGGLGVEEIGDPEREQDQQR